MHHGILLDRFVDEVRTQTLKRLAPFSLPLIVVDHPNRVKPVE
jgi:hypothetical protein